MAMFEHCTVEWLWNNNSIRCNLPGGQEHRMTGSYNEVVGLLNQLGGQGWEAVNCAAGGNWLFWTLKRQLR